jgi:hypothetical protein
MVCTRFRRHEVKAVARTHYKADFRSWARSMSSGLSQGNAFAFVRKAGG